MLCKFKVDYCNSGIKFSPNFALIFPSLGCGIRFLTRALLVKNLLWKAGNLYPLWGLPFLRSILISTASLPDSKNESLLKNKLGSNISVITPFISLNT